MDYNNKQIQELIDHYLMGKMNQAEKADFEQQIANDPELKEEVELSRHIIRALQYEGEKETLEAMKGMTEEELKQLLFSANPVVKPNRYTLFIRIASVAAAAVICLLIYTGTRPVYTTEQLFADYYTTQPYETYGHRGAKDLTPEQVDMLKEAKRLYEQKKYTQALDIYSREFLEKTDSTYLPEEVLFHTAICKFETGDTAGSIKILTDLADLKETDFREESLWNLSLIYLKTGQRSNAKENLTQLVKMDAGYANKASGLLQKLNEKRWF